MGYSFAQRLDHLGQRKKELDSRLVAYYRGSDSVNILASISEPERTDIFPNAIITSVNNRDYIVDADELILNSKLVLPQAGDRIADTDGTFEVRPMADDSLYKFTTQTR